jgi:hypothetical protein
MKKSQLRKIIKEEISKVLSEGKLSPEQQERLDSLRDELRSSIDPDNEYYDYEGRDEVEIRADIRLEFGDKIADQIEDGEYEMHYPRETGVQGFQGDDKLAKKERWGYNKYRTTKSGKMHRQDVEAMKNRYKK